MYESPISITERLLDEYAKMVIERRDNEILAKVQSVVGVDVDKGELLRALQYDRDQYEKGYADAKADIKEFANDVAYQFGYYCQCDGRLQLTHGGLSVLEWAFEILGWDNLHPVPECECEFDGCHEHATCGTPTKDGYKRVCGKHFSELQKEA